jgi:hypothetical protein
MANGCDGVIVWFYGTAKATFAVIGRIDGWRAKSTKTVSADAAQAAGLPTKRVPCSARSFCHGLPLQRLCGSFAVQRHVACSHPSKGSTDGARLPPQ